MIAPPPEIDKAQLYGEYQKWADARAKLGMKVAHKALDIPQDDMQISAPRTQTTNISGISTRGIIGTVLASGLGTGILGAALVWLNSRAAEKPIAAVVDQPTVVKPAPVKPAAAYEFDEVEQLQQPDGTWKPTGKRVRKRVNPDGTVQTRQPDGSWK